jgi:hypothetical protein
VVPETTADEGTSEEMRDLFWIVFYLVIISLLAMFLIPTTFLLLMLGRGR